MFERTGFGWRLRSYYRERVLYPLIAVAIFAGFLGFIRNTSQQHNSTVPVAAVSAQLPGGSSLPQVASKTGVPAFYNPHATNTELPQPAVAIASGSREKIVLLARAEYAKRPVAYDANVLTYTQGVREAWCADFVSYILYRAGQPMKHPSTGSWRLPAVTQVDNYYRSNDRWRPAGGYRPQPGDTAIYLARGWQHVNIVVAVNGDTMTTIGGNESGRVSLVERKIAYGAGGLSAFGLPQ